MPNKANLFSQEYQKEQSEKYKYKHIHTGEYCTFEAYVAEYIILRRSERLGLDRPSYKFWTKGDPNHWIWLKQLNAARFLKTKYSERAIIEAMKSSDFNRYLLIGLQNGRGWKINPHFEKIVQKYEKLSQKEVVQKQPDVEIADNPVKRQGSFSKKKNIIKGLRNNGKKES